MAGVELVAAALVAGATAGLTDVAGGAVRDAYQSLRDAVRRRLAKHGDDGEGVLAANEADSGAGQDGLRAALSAAGVDQDEEILAKARALVDALRAAGLQSGTNVVDAQNAKGVQVGDRNTQTNTFN